MHLRLYLARHAHAEDDAVNDGARRLTPKGHKQVLRLAKGLKGTELVTPETIWQSGLARAQETAVGLKEGLGLSAPIMEKRGLAPYDAPDGIYQQLQNLSRSCLIVGHEPNLSGLASLLLTGGNGFERIRFPKASILCLSRLQVPGQVTPWQIEWHVSHLFY